MKNEVRPEQKKGDDKSVDEILLSKGVSSTAQKDKTPLQVFMGSSMAFVIAMEALLIIIFGSVSARDLYDGQQYYEYSDEFCTDDNSGSWTDFCY